MFVDLGGDGAGHDGLHGESVAASPAVIRSTAIPAGQRFGARSRGSATTRPRYPVDREGAIPALSDSATDSISPLIARITPRIMKALFM